MPATKKVAPKAIALTVAGAAPRDTASGKHSAYPKRAPAAATLTLDGKASEMKRVNGAWKGERLEFIYWREEGIARWTDLTANEAKLIDGGAAVTVTNRVTPVATPAAPVATPTPVTEPVATEPKVTKAKRTRRVVAEA